MDTTDCWSFAYEFIVSGEIEKAISLCETEVCSNSINCQRYLGWIYYKRGDMEKSLSWFGKAADQKDGEALFGIGSVLVVKKDFQSAVSYFERAANNGYPRGYQWAGSIYHRGSGVSIDLDRAEKYYRQGAAHGYIMAERSLISLRMKKENIFVKFILIFKFVALLVKATKISVRDINDPRMMDVPNYFKKN
ncbi:tetratricopeptide repeat protein [Rugamonas sp. CCM 8940]|uniref:tetratricopeptide repeat protein n=1 Tax=Rugamonas sp. CCM 8940 TaxID=2765359 RepID=UPI0018F5565B|nr:tetratricopeptide repeat protein [Rugamonas sp. CCM 8940]MBJ7309699.1 sel1 repeat family protein [Rugamonas sp. CCM 8940]